MSRTVVLRRVPAEPIFDAVASVLVKDHGFASTPPRSGIVTYSKSVKALLGLSRTSVACTVTVIEDRAHTRVTIAGILSSAEESEVFDAVESVVAAAGSEAGITTIPNLSPDELDGTRIRVVESGRTRSSNGVRVLNVAGLEAVELTTVVVIGRNPVLAPEDPSGARMLRVADSSVSKTHVAIGFDGTDVWVEDRHSTNGTWLGDEMGKGERLTGGVRVALRGRSVLRLGNTEATIA